MSLFHSRKEQRDEILQERIDDAASCAATTIRDGLASQAVGPFRIELGEKPDGIETEAYMGWVRLTTLAKLGKLGYEGVVECDITASTMASANALGRSPILGGKPSHRNISLLFRQPTD